MKYPLRSAFAFMALTISTSCASQNDTGVRTGNRFEAGPVMSTPRATHALVRAEDGRILAIGGCVADGCDAGPASSTFDFISADGRRIEGTGNLLMRRVQPSAVALSGNRVLVLGGYIDGRVSAGSEIIDVATGKSSRGPDMAHPRSSPMVAALPDGRILVAGGYDGQKVISDAEIFDPQTGQFAATGPLNAGRSGGTASALINGQILIVGGGNQFGTRTALASSELFDPKTGRFSVTGSLAQRRYKHGAMTLASGDVLVIGGSDERDYGGKLSSVELYDVSSGRFRPAGNLARPRFKLADGLLLLDDDRILIAAGDRFPEVFNVASGRSELLDTDLTKSWNYMTVVATDNKTALLVGGYSEGTIELTNRSWLIKI